MKNFTSLLVAGLFSFVLMSASAQTSPQRNCNTFELMEQVFQSDPSARARYAQVQQMIEQQLRTNPQARTQAIITVPVVVHVLLPAAQQAQVTDAIIQNQLDTLNFYYGASPFNTDSLRVYEPFRTTYGRSEIRFCMAQRTPDGLPTNGITRTVTSTIFDGTNVPGAVIVWNPVKYLNIWVVNGGNSGLLGYSYTPGTWAPGDNHQGFVNDYRAFGSGPGTGAGGYHFNEYNGGKTAVHEIGHYFNLAHTWGPNNSGNPGCTLSDGCSDTPPTAAPFFGCPTTVPVTNACSPTAPGVMWQNHMDYADDRCMILFTAEQCTRMNVALNTAPDRVGLITSDGCTPIVTVNDDARIANILTPANNSSTACVPVTPVVTLQNVGSNNLTAAEITVTLNGNPVGAPHSWTGNLTPGASTNITLSANAITPIVGLNTLIISTTTANGNPDGNPANNSFTVTFTRTGGVAVPVIEGFEGGAFPPTGWTLNPAVNPTWQRTPPGFNSANSIKADFWNFGNGTTFNITTPFINVTGEPQINVSFDISHGRFFSNTDRLRVEASNNCGSTWSVVYDKTSATGLTTAGAANGGPYTPSLPSQWLKEELALTGAILTGGPLQLRWVAVSNFGNNIFVDNININKLYARDLAVTAISRPGGAECGPFQPVITVKNVGLETITAFDIVYSTGGPNVTVPQTITLAPGASTNITLASLNLASGNYTFTVRTNNPSNAGGSGDGNTLNDQMTRAFVVRALVSSPLQEGFEAASFPSPGWSIVNPNNNITFVRQMPGYNSTYSAFIDNFSTDLTGQLDWIQSPAFSVLGAGGALADSVIITWDLAYQTYPGLADEFSVRTSSDCGNTFPNVMFSRSGLALAGPAGSGTSAYLAPAANHWQHLRASLGGTALASGHQIAAFRNLQGFGNNLFVDNINIEVLFKRDLKVTSVDRPRSIECSGSFTPVATVKNVGVETVTAFKVAYSINNEPAQTTTVTGTSLARDASMSVNLNPVTGRAPGQYSIRVWSFDPVTVSGTGDQLTINDTLTKGFGITGTTTAPLTETFEGTFPPTGWAYANPDGGQTWAKANVGKNSTGSAYMRNYTYQFEGRVDELYSPSVTYTGVDSVQLSFDLAAATYTYPGTTGVSIDTLEVLVTKDCGNTFTSVWKKWGDALQTINDPNYPQTMEFVPASVSQWRTEVIDLTDNFTPNGPAQVIFRNTNNFENNIYVDNVNLTTRTLPASLKANGYMVLPSPFNNQFTIWHLLQPTSLRSASVYNSAGQMVWKQEYNGNASNQIMVDLSGKPAGTYIVNLRYSDRTRDQQVKIIKLN